MRQRRAAHFKMALFISRSLTQLHTARWLMTHTFASVSYQVSADAETQLTLGDEHLQ